MDDADSVKVYRASRWWEWYWRSGVTFGIGGGVVMVTAAAVAHNGASVPLALIGGGWLLFGLIALVKGRQVASRIEVKDDAVTFVAQGRQTTVAATEILAITRPRHDTNHWGWINVRTTHDGTIKIASRQRDLVELLVDLKAANPRLQTTRI